MNWSKIGLLFLALLLVGLIWIIYRFWQNWHLDAEERQLREGQEIKARTEKNQGQPPDNALCVDYCESCRYRRPSEDFSLGSGVRCDPQDQIWKKLRWDIKYNQTFDDHNLGPVKHFQLPGSQTTFTETPFINEMKKKCALNKDCLGFTWQFKPEYVDGDQAKGYQNLKWQAQMKKKTGEKTGENTWKDLADYGLTFPQGFWSWKYA